MINTQWKTCRPIVYVCYYVVGDIFIFIFIFSYFGGGGGEFNVLLMKIQITWHKKLTTTYVSIRTLREAINQGTTLAAEVPTRGNLKSGYTLFQISFAVVFGLLVLDSLFCINPPPPPSPSANPPISLGHYMKSYMTYKSS